MSHHCVASSLLTITIEGHQERFKDCLKNPLMPVTLTIDHGPPLLRIVPPAISLSTMWSSPLKTPTRPILRTNGTDRVTSTHAIKT